MRCPKCCKEGVIEHAIEVDNGVGTQRHLESVECSDCGHIGVCSFCGRFENLGHSSYCPDSANPC
jgi:hypothetical protein